MKTILYIKQIQLNVFMFFVIMFVLLIQACSKEEHYIQLKSEDLKYLYFKNKDTLIYDGKTIEETDSVNFLMNDSDTINVKVKSVCTYKDHGFLTVKYVVARSILLFNNLNNNFPDIIIIVDELGEGLIIWNKTNYVYVESRFKDYLIDHQLDTALIMNYLYTNVYKFGYDSSLIINKYNQVWFALGYGVIKIEMMNGEKIELIKK